ncbi:MAG: hypothetical protein QM750_27135 [Rubrivivax sp.]
MTPDTTANGLRAAARALEQVVRPALDAGNPLAVEQLQMVMRFLGLAAERLPWRHARLRRQVRQLADAAQALRAAAQACGDEVQAALAAAADAADAALAHPETPEAPLEQAGAALAAALSALVRESAVRDEATRRAVERTVLQAAGPWAELQRAWFAPLGLDAEAEGLAPPAQQLHPTPDRDDPDR